jgi:hypothetical protein
VVDVVKGHGYGTAALEVWPFGNTSYFRHTFSIDGAVLMLGTAAVIGVGAAWPPARRGDNRIGVVLSGAAGPLLVAAAYVLTIPALVGVTGNPQASASIIAPYALLAGLAGSGLLVAAITGREASQRERRPGADTGDDGEPDTVQLRKPSAGTGSAPRATGPAAASAGMAPALAAAKARAGVAKAPAPRSPADTVSASAKVPSTRSFDDDTTSRIPTSPKRAAETPAAKGHPTTTQQVGTSTSGITNPGSTGPAGGNSNNKRGRRR